MKKLTTKQEAYLNEIGRLWENYGKKRYYIKLKEVASVEQYGERWDEIKIEGIDIKESNAWKRRAAISSYIEDCGDARIFYDMTENKFYSNSCCDLEAEINSKIIKKIKKAGGF